MTVQMRMERRDQGREAMMGNLRKRLGGMPDASGLDEIMGELLQQDMPEQGLALLLGLNPEDINPDDAEAKRLKMLFEMIDTDGLKQLLAKCRWQDHRETNDGSFSLQIHFGEYLVIPSSCVGEEYKSLLAINGLHLF